MSEAIEEAVMCCAQTDHITACFDRLPAHEMKPVHEKQPAHERQPVHVRPPAHEGQLLLEASYIGKASLKSCLYTTGLSTRLFPYK